MDDTLAGMLKSYPAIWDRKNRNFKSKIKKEQAFSDLALILNTTSDIVKSRYWALREKYRKEKIKYELAMRSGSESECYDSWHLMETLSFLNSVMTTRRTASSFANSNSQDPSCAEDIQEESFCESREEQLFLQHVPIDEVKTEVIDLSPCSSIASTTEPKTKKCHVEKENFVDEAMSRLANSAYQNDECDNFAKFVANSLGSLNQNNRNDCMFEIHSVLHKYKKM